MSTVLDKASIPRKGLAFQRFLAVILFSGAAIFGMAGVGALLMAVHSGDWRTLGGGAIAVLVAWVLAWLGTLLWSDRRIPAWFTTNFMIGICAVPLVSLFAKGDWKGALTLLIVSSPALISTRSALRSATKKPRGLDDLDD